MGVDHRRLHVLVPKQFLNGPNIVAVLEQVRRKGVAQGVTGGMLGDSRRDGGRFDDALEDRRIHVMPPLLAWFCVEALTCSLTARWVRKALISGSAISTGWRTL